MKIHFEPEQVLIEGTIFIADKNDKILDEYKETFTYRWDTFNEIIDSIN